MKTESITSTVTETSTSTTETTAGNTEEATSTKATKAKDAKRPVQPQTDEVETSADDRNDLSGKDAGRQSLRDVKAPQTNATTIAKPRDLTARDGKTYQIAKPNDGKAGTSTNVNASTAEKVLSVADDAAEIAGEAKGIAETVDLTNTVARQRGLLNATYSLWGAKDATNILKFNSKLPKGPVSTHGGGALTIANTAQNAWAIGKDLRDGKLSSDSVMPALDIASDIAGETKHPLAIAWSAGWSLGRTADKYTGASDKASDYAAYGTTKPWAGTIEGRRRRIAMQKQATKQRRETAAAARREREAEQKARAPKAAADAPRLDADNTTVDRTGRVFIDGVYVGHYEQGRYITAQGS